MNCKIIFLLTCFNNLVIATRNNYFPGESSRSEEDKQEHLEEMYNGHFVTSLNFMPTLETKTVVDFDDNDVKHLSEECYSDQRCLSVKKASVKKYHQKMQAIQCVNGLFVMEVLDGLKAIIYDEKSANMKQLKNILNQQVIKYKFYLTRMFSVLHFAKWDAYAWQIEILTFVVGLTTSNVDLEMYKNHFVNHHARMQTDVSMFVSRCYQYSICHFVDNIYKPMDFLYNNKNELVYAYSHAEYYIIPYLMLLHLHAHHNFIYDWSEIDINLKTTNVKQRLKDYIEMYGPHEWALDPIHGNKYNALILDCIRLRVMYHTWFHLNIYHILQSRQPGVNASRILSKNSVLRIWYTLVIPLKKALMAFRLDEENIYWSAISDLMVDIDTISVDKLAEREQFTRNYFSKTLENLGFANASEVSQKLTEIEVSEDYAINFRRIKDNAHMLDNYTFRILDALLPVDGAFIRVVVSADGNETFFLP